MIIKTEKESISEEERIKLIEKAWKKGFVIEKIGKREGKILIRVVEKGESKM